MRNYSKLNGLLFRRHEEEEEEEDAGGRGSNQTSKVGSVRNVAEFRSWLEG